jgi:hypothetical protein
MRLSGPAILAVAASLVGLSASADPPAKAAAAADPLGRAPVSASLLGEGWSMVNANGSVSLDSVTMPTHALAALEDAKVIGDPLYRCVVPRKGRQAGTRGSGGREQEKKKSAHAGSARLVRGPGNLQLGRRAAALAAPAPPSARTSENTAAQLWWTRVARAWLVLPLLRVPAPVFGMPATDRPRRVRPERCFFCDASGARYPAAAPDPA